MAPLGSSLRTCVCEPPGTLELLELLDTAEVQRLARVFCGYDRAAEACVSVSACVTRKWAGERRPSLGWFWKN